MKLIVDTNRLIAALVRDSYSRRVLLSERFDFHTVALSKRELAKYEDELQKKSGLSCEQFHDLVDFLFGQVSILDDASIRPFMPDASAAMDSVDPNDAPFIAAALAIKADGVWTHDPHFDRQTLVKVFNTDDLLALL